MNAERKQTKPFALFLQEHRKGSLHTELSEQLAEVTQGVLEHGKAGSITVTINVSPIEGHRAGDNIVRITDKVTPKVPQPERGSAMFFADEEGNLHRNNPLQDELPGLRPVEGTSDLVDTTTGEVIAQ